LRLTDNISTEDAALRLTDNVSTEDAAFSLTVNVFKSVSQKMHVGGILYDLAKTFGCVNHEIVLAKLHFCGI